LHPGFFDKKEANLKLASIGIAAVVALAATPAFADWNGFYAGLNGGWAWASSNISETPFGVTAINDITPETIKPSPNGALFGVQFGYNYQSENWLVGLEGDFDGASLTDNSQVIFPSLAGELGSTDAFAANEKIDWLASARVRGGITMDSALVYITGGVVVHRVVSKWAKEKPDNLAIISADTAPGTFSQSGTGRFTQTRTGYVLGAGYEWMIAPEWSVRGEYLFYDFSGNNFSPLPIPGCDVGPCGVTMKIGHNEINEFRVAVNYMFN
jgi:outer membrane immunogenic protein